MRAILYEFSRGFAYRKIVHSDMHWYTKTLPLIFGLLTGGAFILMPEQPMLLGKDGFLVMVLSVLATLPGFYFAGLAAVATFNGMNMDNLMPAPAPVLKVWTGGAWIDLSLSRRQFLSYLFSYLVAVSFLLCAAILVVNATAPAIKDLKEIFSLIEYGNVAWQFVRGGLIITFAVALGSMIATTLQGMFFLAERIHQP